MPDNDPWWSSTSYVYASTFADVWWQARWSANPNAPVLVTTRLDDELTQIPYVFQVNAMGILRVRNEHIDDVVKKLRLAADALEKMKETW